MKVLVTGGAGYIGSHTCVELVQAGHRVVVLDNLVNAKAEAVVRVERIVQRDIPLHRVDMTNAPALDEIMAREAPDAVIHFAGLKAVGESVSEPLRYYENNVGGTFNLCRSMIAHGVKTVIFSSSATVYGDPNRVPIPEEAPVDPTNPYGRTKLAIEHVLADIQPVQGWRVVILRYFNPIGAHESGQIGEDPQGIPNNLCPYVAQVATGRLDRLSIFGDDWPTPDGTGIRDYIHVMDLAAGHVRALTRAGFGPGLDVYNLGTGRGTSVLELVRAFERASGRTIPYRMSPRRPGDVAQCFADPSRAKRELGWKAHRNIDEMCRDVWRWQSGNPEGYPQP
ncbi:MAG: UDP-glucose 4-epimerase GalE [Deltaproteobacteria bacterium]|nr:UDP-glucose 4-epimerase GalE [Deltaproteobacteria bacterium]